MRSSRALGRLAVFLTLLLVAGPAKADPANDLALRIKLDRSEHALGEEVVVHLSLENKGAAPIRGRALVFDWRSVYFHVRVGDLDYYRVVFQDEEPSWITLDPGKPITAEIRVPVVVPGATEITAKYRGFQAGRWSDLVSSNSLTTQVAGSGALHAVVETTKGTIKMRLLPEAAPNTVANFVSIARAGTWNGTVFHRIIKGFMIQGGDPKGDGSGGPGWSVPQEFNATKHVPGTVSMARTPDPDSAGCQFFICHGSPSHLDGQYTAFAKVVEGLEVVNAMAEVRTGQADRPLEPIRINKIDLAVE